VKFEGKTVIVTGAGRGIGEAYALGFARERANVVVVDVVASRAESTAKKVEEAGGKSLVQAMDVSKKKDVDAMAEKTVERFGRIDALVNNAGVLFQEPFLTSTEEQYYKIYDVNVKGLFLCAQAVARQMIKQKKGAVLNLNRRAVLQDIRCEC